MVSLARKRHLALKTGKHKEGIVSAKDDVKDITVLVERLLEFARLDTFALQLEKIDLSSLVQTTIEKYAILAKEKGIMVQSTLANSVFVEGDAALLRQVVSNLLINAVKFNTSGGKVVVTLTKEELTVADTGIGIAAADLPNIFHRFFQADSSRSKEGFGLGLALVRRIIDIHGWTISVESVVDRGTTFRIRLVEAR